MSIEQSNTIDFIGIDKTCGSTILTITDHLEWGSREHLIPIQEKLNSYLTFIESGEILDSYPAANDKPTRIDIFFLFEPDEEGTKFLSLCDEIIRNAGFGFRYCVKNNTHSTCQI